MLGVLEFWWECFVGGSTVGLQSAVKFYVGRKVQFCLMPLRYCGGVVLVKGRKNRTSYCQVDRACLHNCKWPIADRAERLRSPLSSSSAVAGARN